MLNARLGGLAPARPVTTMISKTFLTKFILSVIWPPLGFDTTENDVIFCILLVYIQTMTTDYKLHFLRCLKIPYYLLLICCL